MAEGIRLRLRYLKKGKVRFTSHRDVARALERAIRLSALPVAWSQGFSPRPLVSFGLALPTGSESDGEFVDVRLEEATGGAFCAGIGTVAQTGLPVGEDPDRVARLRGRLGESLPEGLAVTAAGVVGPSADSLQQTVEWCDWELEVAGVSTAQLSEAVGGLLAAGAVVIERDRKGRKVTEDVRPAISTIAILPGDLSASRLLAVRTATHPRGVRPREVVAALGGEISLTRSLRRKQWIDIDGLFVEPLACAPNAHAADLDGRVTTNRRSSLPNGSVQYRRTDGRAAQG